MRPLSRDGAKYFCGNYSGHPPQATDIRDLYDSVLDKKALFKEKDPVYGQYRDCLLRESDRAFFLAISCFRHALDGFTGSASFWAYVTLYYSSWFAAQSILGMFGCWVRGARKGFRIVVEASQQIPGSQEFKIEKNYSSSYSGSHQLFWDAYYRAMKNVVFWTDQSLLVAVTPINNNPTWAIDRRNMVNYQSLQTFKLMDDYKAKFDQAIFPDSLPGDMLTQFQLSRAMLLFCAERAVEFGLRTDVFSPFGTRVDAIRDLIYNANPTNLSSHAEQARLTV